MNTTLEQSNLNADSVEYQRSDLVAAVRDIIKKMSIRGVSTATLNELAENPILRLEVDHIVAEGFPAAEVFRTEFSTFDILALFRIDYSELAGGDTVFEEEDLRQDLLQTIINDDIKQIEDLQSVYSVHISRLEELAERFPNISAEARATNLKQVINFLPEIMNLRHPTAIKIIDKTLPELRDFIERVIRYIELLTKLSADLEISVKDAIKTQINQGNSRLINAIADSAGQLGSSLPAAHDIASKTIGGIVRHDTSKKVTRGNFIETILVEKPDQTGYQPLDESDSIFQFVQKGEHKAMFDLSVREYIEDTLDLIGYYTCYLKSKLGLEVEAGEFRSVFSANQSEQILEAVGDDNGTPIQFLSSDGFARVGTAALNSLNHLVTLKKLGSELSKYPVQVKEVINQDEIPSNETEGVVELYASPADSKFKYKTVQVSNFTTLELAESFYKLLHEYKDEIAAGARDGLTAQGLKLIGVTMTEQGKGNLLVELSNVELDGQAVVRVDVFITYPVDNMIAESNVFSGAKQ